MAKIIPSYPQTFEMPFAHNGDKQPIPTASTVTGKAAMNSGFPEECSRPLGDEGVPPARTCVNGILNLLSAWAFYYQAGGLATFDTTINYIVPALVYHAGIVFTCKKASGPQSADGVRVPGANNSAAHWTPGFGEVAANIHGNNANLYITTGTYWIDDATATSNFPQAGIGGFLTVAAKNNIIHQSMVLRNSQTNIHSRHSTNGGSSWTGWIKILFTSDVRNAAYKDIYINPTTANDAIGQNGDIWFHYQ